VVDCGWVSHARAVLHGFLGGQAGASGLLDVLTGAVNPSGRLAETIPLSLADTPAAGRFPSPGPTAEYREGPFVGYRYYTSAGVPVAFPFGFGLSYTTFALGALKATASQVTAEVTNTGQAPGAEVVQVYVRRTTPGILRPDRELKGFARVELEPGQTRSVAIDLDSYAFRFFDVRTGTWERETGDYEILVGPNAADLAVAGTVHIDGTGPAAGPDLALAALNAVAVHDVTDAEFAHLLGHPIPPTDEGRTLTAADPLGRLTAAPSALGRLVGGFLHRQVEKGEKAGKPNLDALFQVNMPFRAIPKMMGGMVDQQMVDGILHLVNGHFFAGLGRTVKAFFANRRADKATRAELGV